MFRPRPRAQRVLKRPFDLKRLYSFEELGLFLDKDDIIKSIAEPDKRYEYRMKKPESGMRSSEIELYNDCLWFSLTKTIAHLVLERLRETGLHEQVVPVDADSAEPHTQILLSQDYCARPELTVVIPDGGELGVWTGRLVSQEGIHRGSLVNFCQLFATNERGVVIANPMQLLWHKELMVALSPHQYRCAEDRIPNRACKISGNERQQEHIAYLMNNFVKNAKAEVLSVVVVGYAGYCLLQYLNDNWIEWKNRMLSIVFISSSHSVDDAPDESCRNFLRDNCIQFCASEQRLMTIIKDDRFGCPVVSGGHDIPESLPAYCLEAAHSFIDSVQTGKEVKFLEAVRHEELEEHYWDDQAANVLSGDINPRGAWDGVPEVVPVNDTPLTALETARIAQRLPMGVTTDKEER